MAFQFAFRFSLIIFAVIAFRGVLDGSGFSETLKTALQFGLFGLIGGFIVGSLSRQLVEETTEFGLKAALEKAKGSEEMNETLG